MTLPAYVLITPARNEAQFIELTLKSVVSQTALPLRWVIVSDGSTDGTDEIVNRYMADHPWIELLRMPERRERHFAGKVHAFNAGYARVKNLSYGVIGSIDADISFDSEYFFFLLGKIAGDHSLGLVGTPFKDDSMYDYRFVSIEHVSGACQLFRRECFEEIGGYVPIKSGGIDHIAVITARMKGWKTRTFTDKICLHHRKIGMAERGALHAKFRVGRQDYALGGHPVWELFRTVYQMSKKPYVVGGLTLLAGYISALIRGDERAISNELMAFRRREQMQRLAKFLMGSSGTKQPNSAASCWVPTRSCVIRSRLKFTSTDESGKSRSVLMPPDNFSARATQSFAGSAFGDEPTQRTVQPSLTGRLIVNADDWGRDRKITDRINECSLRRSVSSVSAMVFMEDSERAAALASERGIDAGLHLNFTTPFSAQHCPASLTEHQQPLTRYLLRHRLAQVMFHPGLVRSFEYVVAAQIEEFCRLYGRMPDRIDGHHHMHLCANVLWGKLLLPGGNRGAAKLFISARRERSRSTAFIGSN